MSKISPVLGSLLVAVPLAAGVPQSIPVSALKPANATIKEEFTSVVSVRELADRRVLVVVDRDQRVVVADLRSGTVTQVGRQGNGPEEYRFPLWLLAVARAEPYCVDWRGADGRAIIGTPLRITLKKLTERDK
ncbi:MAG TPA: hypothetical protein VIH11_07190 [Gemmatimonadaceae bacterium]|nr:hypothetical protein [Gemmatimonadaceae bacterium]